MTRATAIILAAALPLLGVERAFADAQDKLVEKAAKELIALNDDMLKALKTKPEELGGRQLYIRAHVQPKADGAAELKIEEISEGEQKRPLKSPDGTVYLKGTLKPQPDRTWKLSIDDVLPKDKPTEEPKNKDGDPKGK
jgi:hypothetical protein